MTAVLVIASVVALVALDALLLWLRGRHVEARPEPLRPFGALRLPRGLFVGEAHTWARLAESGELEVGADELLTQAVGSVERVEVVKSGAQLRAGDVIATVWRGDRRLLLRSPVSGTVVTVNDTLRQSPALMDGDPYGSGWLATVLPVEHGEALRALRVGEAARRWLEREVQRLADFLAMASRPAVRGEVIADGAHPVVGAAVSLGDDEWEEFEKLFTAGV